MIGAASTIDPGWLGLAASMLLMVVVLVVALCFGINMIKDGAVAAARATIQLVAVGLLLGWIFARSHWWAICLMLAVMTAVAGFTGGQKINKVLKRTGPLITLILACVTALTLVYVTQFAVGVHRFTAQYFIPIGGIILGNAMTAAVLATTRYAEDLKEQRDKVEAALALGASPAQATREMLRKAFTAAITPTINAMLIVGIVKLPGIMTGTLLGGVAPLVAAKYQLVVLFMLIFGDGMTSLLVLAAVRRRVFTSAWQLRL
ncbi:MAG: iron export ABC transporter permease subunit FetB [Planctomycetes bacterium]|nr:iron export ABC transporter permease subunit FetB [Planctomycetota bacterium]